MGNGMLAAAVLGLDRPDVVFFCGGVSDSAEVRAAEFERERALLGSVPAGPLLVYTSSLDAVLARTPYQRHKLAMETQVGCRPHLILRVGNLVAARQPAWQFFPAIRAQVSAGMVVVRPCRRDLLWVEDYAACLAALLAGGATGTVRCCSARPPLVSQIVAALPGGPEARQVVVGEGEPDYFVPDVVTGGGDYYLRVIRKYEASNPMDRRQFDPQGAPVVAHVHLPLA